MTLANESTPSKLPTQEPTKKASSLKTFAIVSLVIGAWAFLIGFMPVFGLVTGVAAVVTGVMALRRGQAKGMSVTGLILGSIGGLTSLIVTVSFFAGLGATSNKPEAASSKVASAIARAQSSPKPVENVTTEAGLRAAIEKQLGTTTNRGVPRNVIVQFEGRDLLVWFALNENLTNKLVIVGAWKGTEEIVKLAQQSGLVDNLYVFGTYAFQDKYGNASGEGIVFNAEFLEGSIPKINTDAFTGSMYADVATSVTINPSFQ
jgi:hypothetical protein